ncbi:hypothetical protein DFH06DRAFT_1143034 [Mycena polygramma]|nr:hypothetical protein DFH06DRAFT_1143034 [Mycena polygramma]
MTFVVIETPFSTVAPALAEDIPVKTLVVITIFVAISIILRCGSPARLTLIVEDAMSRAKIAFADAVEAGHLSASGIVSESEKWTRFLEGRTFTVLRCIWAVQDFETQLKKRSEIESSERKRYRKKRVKKNLSHRTPQAPRTRYHWALCPTCGALPHPLAAEYRSRRLGFDGPLKQWTGGRRASWIRRTAKVVKVPFILTVAQQRLKESDRSLNENKPEKSALASNIVVGPT